MCLPCAQSPSTPLHTHTHTHIHKARGVWACVLTCREQHRPTGSMLIVASWEEINTAIKGDITPLPQQELFMIGVWRFGGGSTSKRSPVLRIWSKGWVKAREGPPESSTEEELLLSRLIAAAVVKVFQALMPVKAQRRRLVTIRGESQEVERGAC